MMRRDMISGAALVCFGSLYALYTYFNLPLGTPTRMGPGMFPLYLGVLLAFFGGLIFLSSLSRDYKIEAPGALVALGVLGGIAAFALLIQRLGLIPSIVVSALITSAIMPGFSWSRAIWLCIGLSALAYVLFIFALGIRMPLILWTL